MVLADPLRYLPKDLLPVMLEITAWSGKYDAKTNTPPALRRALKGDRQPLIDKVLSNLDKADLDWK